LGGKNGGKLGFCKWVISRRNREWSKGKLLLEFYFPEIQNNTPEHGLKAKRKCTEETGTNID
jgi:hypothetical protein